MCRTPQFPKRCRLLCVSLILALLTGSVDAGRAEEFSGRFASAVLMDAETGEILIESNIHSKHQTCLDREDDGGAHRYGKA